MKIISTNIGDSKTIMWGRREVTTGIYKYPVDKPIYLGENDVRNDHVVDRRVHGGINKACYLFAVDHYPYWKDKFPDLEWQYGMFGENLTVLGLDERHIKIGSIYTLGESVVQITQPRQPCFKLGIRFGAQSVLKDFIQFMRPGMYIKVLVPGFVKVNDVMVIKEEHEKGVTITEMHRLLYDQQELVSLAKRAIQDPFVTTNNKNSILGRYGSSIA